MLIAIGLNINGVNNTHNINNRYLLCAFFIFNMPTLNAHAKAYQPIAIIPIMQSAMSPNNSRNSIIQIIIKSFYFIKVEMKCAPNPGCQEEGPSL